MRRELKKMEKRMDREDERELKQLEGRPKRHILRNVLLIALGTIAAALVAGYFLFDVPSWQRLDIQKITAVQQTGAMQLTDLSYNGTYVRFADSEIVSLRRGSCLLHGNGAIGLGGSPADPTSACVRFEVLRFGDSQLQPLA